MVVLFRRLAVAIVLLSQMAVVPNAAATPVRIYYEATVYYTQGDPFGYVVGDTISGWFEFNTDTLLDTSGNGSYLEVTAQEESSTVESDKSFLVDRYSQKADLGSLYNYANYDELNIQDGSVGSCFRDCSSGNWYEVFGAYLYLTAHDYSDWLDILLGSGELPSTGVGNLYLTKHFASFATYEDLQNDNGVSYTYAAYASIDILRITPVSVFNSVTIDIKPGASPNDINAAGKQKVPVAVMTTNTFDATQVDWETVSFGPNGAIEVHGRAHIEDVDEDGGMDMVLHFDTQEAGVACSDTEATLTGETFDGGAITGTDAILIVNCD